MRLCLARCQALPVNCPEDLPKRCDEAGTLAPNPSQVSAWVLDGDGGHAVEMESKPSHLVVSQTLLSHVVLEVQLPSCSLLGCRAAAGTRLWYEGR